MRLALAEAEKAYARGEIPIGAVLVRNEDGTVVSRGHNLRESKHDATAHAELEAIREACAGALVNSRIDRLVYGSTESKFGAVESIFNVVNHRLLNHRLSVTAGVLEDECRQLMKDFFRMRREQNKQKKREENSEEKSADS